MAILIGTDEAGYGPNFGPLVISATRWLVPDVFVEHDLYDLLAAAISREPGGVQLAVADSKALYKPGGGLGQLERGVLAATAVSGRLPDSWQQIWTSLAPGALAELSVLPWYAGFDRRLPIDCELEEVHRLRRLLAAACGEQQIELQRIESVPVFPDRFNRLVAEHGSKGAALSAETLALVARLINTIDAVSEHTVHVQCDKHGGRNRYGPLLQGQFPDYLVEVVAEGRAASVYNWGPAERRIQFRFVAKGESFLPTALASMASKYVRELAMQAFNAFWAGHLPDLKPTAGYPVDAARFRRQIREVQSELGIQDQVLWRNR